MMTAPSTSVDWTQIGVGCIEVAVPPGRIAADELIALGGLLVALVVLVLACLARLRRLSVLVGELYDDDAGDGEKPAPVVPPPPRSIQVVRGP